MHYSQVVNGIVGYIDDELLSKMKGTGKAWLAGTVVGLAASRAEAMIRQYSSNPLVKASGLIDGENIDVDAIYAELLRQAQKGSATIQIPLMGAVTFDVKDVESLYRHIKEGR